MDKKICAASDCNKEFMPVIGKQIYCSTQCKEREKKRNARKIRVKKGFCPQCGEEMDAPNSHHSNKISPQYCSKCQGYYHQRYVTQKGIRK